MLLKYGDFHNRQLAQNLAPKVIMTHLHKFSHALRQLHVTGSSFDWFSGFSVSFVIGWNDYFAFWFYDTQLNTALFNVSLINSVPYTIVHFFRLFYGILPNSQPNNHGLTYIVS